MRKVNEWQSRLHEGFRTESKDTGRAPDAGHSLWWGYVATLTAIPTTEIVGFLQRRSRDYASLYGAGMNEDIENIAK